jgi:hypothetical protein
VPNPPQIRFAQLRTDLASCKTVKTYPRQKPQGQRS